MAELKPIECIIRIESNRKGTSVDVSLVKELVRCKDCKYGDYGFCDEVLEGQAVADEFFCACGKRREG